MQEAVEVHEKFLPLFERGKYRYKVAHGGRGGMKTTHFALALARMGAAERLSIMCGREFMNTMDDSVKPAIEKAIETWGLGWFYKITKTEIVGRNGTRFRFKGLARNIMSIKGWEDVDICWIEEANITTSETLELIKPTIRKSGSEIWLSFNRHKRSDPVDKMFLGKAGPPPRTWLQKVGWQDNRWWSSELEEERLECLEKEPERYRHIWEGEPDDNPGGKVVLPYGQLQKCVDVHKQLGYNIDGVVNSGLDPADDGEDVTGYASRRGPLLFHVESWDERFLFQTSQRAHARMLEQSSLRLYYDAGGLGAGVKSDLYKLRKAKTKPLYITKPFLFGQSPVNGADREYIKGVKNKDFFSRQNAQAWWNLRRRMQNTIKLLHGKSVKVEDCLFIDGDIPELDQLLLELSQCVYDYDSSNRIVIDKQPDGTQSPNLADATIMAFAADIRKGLKA